MTNPQPKTGTVTINGRVYTYLRHEKFPARVLDLTTSLTYFALLRNGNEEIHGPFLNEYEWDEAGYNEIPATTTRPRELKDVIAELAKGGVPWTRSPSDNAWAIRCQLITESTIECWNSKKFDFSVNPFKENPTILGPEITEELKP